MTDNDYDMMTGNDYDMMTDNDYDMMTGNDYDMMTDNATSCDIGKFYKSKSTSSSKPLMPCRPCPVDHNSPWYLSITRPTGPTRI